MINMNLKVKNISNVGGEVKAPPSKSYSHRAVILASLAKGTSKLYDMLFSEDTISSINVCKTLGAKITENDDYLEVVGTGGKFHNSSDDYIDLGNSGTTLRIMTSLAGLSDNDVIFTGDDSLKTRPMGVLMDALKDLGVSTKSLKDNEKAPILIKPGYGGGEVSIPGNISSQFISSILISAPLSEKGVQLSVLPDFKSKPYVDMSLDIMSKFGVDITEEVQFKHDDCGKDCVDITEEIQFKHDDCSKDYKTCAVVYYDIPKNEYKATDYVVEGDYSSASYLLAAIAILGGEAKIFNLFKDSKQGDKVILDIIRDMGADIEVHEDYVKISSDGNLKAIDVNLSDSPDLLITVAVLASLAEGTSKITGVAHARVKETDRIATTCSNSLAYIYALKKYCI